MRSKWLQCLICLFFSISSIAAAGEKKLNIGISLVDLSNPFFSILAREISNEVELGTGGNANVLIRSSAYDLTRQISQLGAFIEEGVDILFIAASETEAIAPVIRHARENGIIVVAVDIEAVGTDISVSSDNFQAGTIACEYLAGQLSGKGKVAIINGSPISSVIHRVDGCRNSLKQYQNIDLVSYERNSSGTFSGGLESMTYLLLEYPDLDGVFAINDPSALGAEEAARQMNIDRPLITSVDASPEVLKRLKSGKSNLIASVAQFPHIMARKAVRLALEKQSGEFQQQRTELIPTKLVTVSNVAKFSQWQEVE
ncbi:hypothetical protein CSW98_05950 [Vibrio sp. HA2012]|uniref:substrate-binding domain-containing protein n=1 Tax=Vibrio sp. HA2012 TaxID=1971595 RepID=UPI000C2C3E42|nr:substrate-binding domain-containing protein [Vibrio sp. HA2012]PJC87438.1 hypothetical protein CSW98_05950 [Vibrio sp. HA2012]